MPRARFSKKGPGPFLSGAVLATRWDEPWQEEVVKNADAFVKAGCVANEKGKRRTLKVLKHLAGVKVPEEVTVDRFSLLRLTSYSVDELTLDFKKDSVGYFFLNKGAARALAGIETPSARERLFRFLKGDGVGFAKVMAVWGLKRQGARDYLSRLKALQEKAPEDPVGFGGNLMDPRIGTMFPTSVREAIKDLVAEWSKPTTRPAPATRSTGRATASRRLPLVHTASGNPEFRRE